MSENTGEEPKVDQSDIEERMRAAQARLEAAEKKREALSKEREAERKLREMEREAADAEVLAELEAKYGERGKSFDVVETDEGLVGVKKPARPVYERFQNHGFQKGGETLNMPEAHKFLKHVVIHPDWGKFETICDELPGTPLRVINAASGLARGRRAESPGK